MSLGSHLDLETSRSRMAMHAPLYHTKRVNNRNLSTKKEHVLGDPSGPTTRLLLVRETLVLRLSY